MNISGTVCQRIHYFPGKQWLAIDIKPLNIKALNIKPFFVLVY